MTHHTAAKQSYVACGQLGMTLVEVMVALTLSIVLLGSVIQIYLSSKQTYRVDDALSRLQEGGRIAMDVLTYDIRMAGYQGCADPVTVPTTVMANTLNAIPITNLFPNAIAGIQGNDNPNSDSLTLRYGDPTTATPVTADNSTTITIASNPVGYAANDYLLVSDCTTADIFQATTVTTTSIAHTSAKNTPAATKGYPTTANVLRFAANTYSVLDTGRKNERGAPVRALFRTDVNNTRTEIVDGIEYLEVSYCERLTNKNLRCVPANDANLDMSRVVSVRLGMLLVSDDAVLDANDTREYPLVDTIIKPGVGAAKYDNTDRRMRRVFTTTVRLRNRR